MKTIKESLPLILLVGIVPYFFYGQPNLAQAIIAVGLAGLSGFKFYLEQKDFEKVFRERLDARDKETSEKLATVQKEMDQLREKQGSLQLVQDKVKRSQNFSW